MCVHSFRDWKVTCFQIDINECVPVGFLASHHVHYLHNCHADANCSNTVGSFFCTCHTGYSGDGVTCLGKQFVP